MAARVGTFEDLRAAINHHGQRGLSSPIDRSPRGLPGTSSTTTSMKALFGMMIDRRPEVLQGPDASRHLLLETW